MDGAAYQWVDLDGEGLAGVLTEQGGAWFYKPNLGDGHASARRMLARSAVRRGGGRRATPAGSLDLAGDGQLDLVELGGPMPGFYERDRRARLAAVPAVPRPAEHRLDDPNLRLVDLDGDGLADVLITGDDALTWYPSLGRDGLRHGQAQPAQPYDEERGPAAGVRRRQQSIYLADMTGDGLSDLVRVRNGEVCYWPNLGYGRFGAKVTMDDAPWLDQPGPVRPAAGAARRHRRLAAPPT